MEVRKELSMLGMGCMRFPRDKAETERMILAAIDSGINFFDTAYLYPGSEVTLGNILAKHNKRKEVFITTKLPLFLCKSEGDFDKHFAKQLERLQTDYIDYYLLHSVSDYAQWEHLKKMGIEKWIAGKKATGEIRKIGFSYHGTCADFLKILDSYAWEICMLQYNYYDENYQAGVKGIKAAAKKGVPVVVMEPLLGGKLATGLPKQAVDMFKDNNQNLTPADWALWWLWNQKEVTVVLSGMSSLQIVQDNIRSANNFRPLADDELSVYGDVVDLFRKSYKINCTGCNYCLPCPLGINIPACLTAYNTSYVQGFVTGMTFYMTSTAAIKKNPTSPHLCNGCGKCEKVCPQYLPIRRSLKKVARRFEPLPLRVLLGVVRRVIGTS